MTKYTRAIIGYGPMGGGMQKAFTSMRKNVDIAALGAKMLADVEETRK